MPSLQFSSVAWLRHSSASWCLGLALLLIHSVQPTVAVCNLEEGRRYFLDGRMPGVWRPNAEPGSKWLPLGDGGCVANLLRQRFDNVGFLWLGDSNDGYVKTPYCWFAGTTRIYPPKNSSFWAVDHMHHNHDHSNLNYCLTDNGMGLAHFYLPGVHPTGPFHMGIHGNFADRMQWALTSWAVNVSTTPPKMVVISSSLWDLSGATAARNDVMLWNNDTQLPWLESYMTNLTNVINYARNVFPTDTVFAFRTSPIPRHDHTTLLMRVIPAHVSHVNKLNAAGVVVAQRLGLPIVDYPSLTAELQTPVNYLVDDVHVKEHVALEAMNLYLNVYSLFSPAASAGLAAASGTAQTSGVTSLGRHLGHRLIGRQ